VVIDIAKPIDAQFLHLIVALAAVPVHRELRAERCGDRDVFHSHDVEGTGAVVQGRQGANGGRRGWPCIHM